MSQNGFAQISLFGKMQRGRSPSFELFQLDMYVVIDVKAKQLCDINHFQNSLHMYEKFRLVLRRIYYRRIPLS